MDFARIERRRSVFKILRLCCAISAILCVGLGFSYGLSSIVSSWVTDYGRVFAWEFASEWAVLTARPTSISYQTNTTFENFQKKLPGGQEGWRSYSGFYDWVEDLKAKNIGAFVGQTNFLLLDGGRTIILEFWGKGIDVKPVIKGSKWDWQVSTKPKILTACSITLDLADMRRLNPNSQLDPAFHKFNAGMVALASIFGSKWDEKRFLQRLRLGVSKKQRNLQKAAIYYLFPFSLVLVAFFTFSMRLEYTSFLKGLNSHTSESSSGPHTGVPLPSYREFSRASSIEELHRAFSSEFRRLQTKWFAEKRKERLERRKLRTPRSLVAESESLEGRRFWKVRNLLSLFEELSRENPDPKAVEIRSQAMSEPQDPVARIKLLKAAIRELRAASRPPTAAPVIASDIPGSKSLPTRYVTLGAELERLFPSVDGLEFSDKEALMARQILISIRVFGGHYRPLTVIRKFVINRYRSIGQRFDTSVFRDTLMTLVRQGIVQEHSKMPERTLSLASKPEEGTTAESKELIRKIIEFNRHFGLDITDMQHA